MTDDLSASLAEIRKRSRWTSGAEGIAEPGATAVKSAGDVPRLLAAVDAVLKRHALTAFHRHTEPCARHRCRDIADRRTCAECLTVEWTGCETCRDEFGNPARPEDCKERAAILAALAGEGRERCGL